MILLAMGFVFQVPIAILAITAPGSSPHGNFDTTAATRSSRAAIAGILPGDGVTLVLETVPLYLLFEASVLLASIFERRETRQATRSGTT